MKTSPTDEWIDGITHGAFGRPPGSEPGSEPGSADAPDEPPPIDVQRLLAWRAGELSAADAEAVERVLERDPEARALLRELSEPVPPFLARWAREHARGVLGRGVGRWIPAAVGLALAAAALVFALLPARVEAPGYHVGAVRGGQARVRGAEGPRPERTIVDPDSVLVIALAPDDPRTSAPPAVAFVEGADGRLRRVDRPIEAGEGGALRFEAPVTALFDRGFGARRLWLAIGADGLEPDAIRALAGEVAADARTSLAGVRWLAVEVEYREGLQ